MGTIGQYGGHYYLYRSILSILVGVILLSFPEVSLTYLVYAIGAFTILMGVTTLSSSIKDNTGAESFQKTMSIVNGTINIVLGIILMFAPSFFIGFLMVVIGIFIVVAGLMQLFLLWQRKRIKKQIKFNLFVLPLLITAAGFLVVFNPFNAMVTTVTIMGTIFLFYGIFELIIRMRIYKLGGGK